MATISHQSAARSLAGYKITGDQTASSNPAAFGFRVASPQDAARYDQYVQQGGDPNAIPVYDRLAVAIAKDPNFLTKPENFEEYYSLVYKPLASQNIGEQFNKAMQNIVPSVWQTLQNVGAAANNAVAGVSDQVRMAYNAATGNSAPGPSQEDLTKDLAQRQANVSAGIGQAGSDAYSFLSGIGNGILNLPKPILSAVITDPAQREQMDRGYAAILQDLVGKQQQVQSLGKSLQQVSAHAYAQVNVHAGELVSQATPDPNVVAGTAVLANPLNIVPGIGEGMAVVDAFKPIFFERAINMGEEAAAAFGKKAALDATQVLPQDVMKSATNRGLCRCSECPHPIHPATDCSCNCSYPNPERSGCAIDQARENRIRSRHRDKFPW